MTTPNRQRHYRFDPMGFKEKIAALVAFLEHLGDHPQEIIEKIDQIMDQAFVALVFESIDEADLDAARDALPRPWETDERLKDLLDKFENDPLAW